ncbi:pyridoxamine 5'-phosphate oxidase family protein [Edaphobacter paludis]|uniref:Pyridoxamine 5'-phosphate oxidase family protein n=1 Tax=Edaphobacter paludis TaxID=3035702 RepID=A0AAU7D6L5_9BACT
MDRTSLYSAMSKYRYGVVSSTSSTGTPQSALVGIATTPNLEIIFDTVASSRKYPNLIERPRCSFVVGWGAEQTVQFEGIASLPTGLDLKRYQDTYFAVWPECRTHISWPGIAYFVVRPAWIRFSDYDQKPPLIEEMTF